MIKIKHCPNCGASTEGLAGKFCEMCGTDLSQVPATSPEPSERKPEPSVTTGSAPGGLNKGHLVGGVIALIVIAAIVVFATGMLGSSTAQKETVAVTRAATPGPTTVIASPATTPVTNANGASPPLKIVSATYGYNGREIDATARVSSSITDNRINMQVTNDNMGGDPASGYTKILTVVYQNPFGTHTTEVTENQWLTISAVTGATGTSPNLKILSATYGYNGREIDATARVSSSITDDKINMQVTNDNMGGDPASGYTKTLTVIYQNPLGTNTVKVTENQWLVLSLTTAG